MSWWWLVLAFFAGTFVGLFLVALLAAGRDEIAYRAGFHEGHTEGFRDGVAKWQKVG